MDVLERRDDGDTGSEDDGEIIGPVPLLPSILYGPSLVARTMGCCGVGRFLGVRVGFASRSQR